MERVLIVFGRWVTLWCLGILLAGGSVSSCRKEVSSKAEPVSEATPAATQHTGQTPAQEQPHHETTTPAHSLVTPYLNRAMKDGQNMLWSAAFPLAWSELQKFASGPVSITSSPILVNSLNREASTEGDFLLNPAHYVTAAGFIGDEMLQQVRSASSEPLAAEALKDLSALPPDSLAVYASLRRHLPFQWTFRRFEQPLLFSKTEVTAFGLKQYLAGRPNDQKLAEQVVIADYRSDDDFILELLTTSPDDRLILAKIPPESTFQETITHILERVRHGTPSGLANLESVVIPVIEIDQTEQYRELCGHPIQAENPRVNGESFVSVTQRIRFTLDESGASLDSKMMAFSARSPRQFIFDRPFSVLLLRKDAPLPYFALWVDNDAVLRPIQKR